MSQKNIKIAKFRKEYMSFSVLFSSEGHIFFKPSSLIKSRVFKVLIRGDNICILVPFWKRQKPPSSSSSFRSPHQVLTLYFNPHRDHVFAVNLTTASEEFVPQLVSEITSSTLYFFVSELCGAGAGEKFKSLKVTKIVDSYFIFSQILSGKKPGNFLTAFFSTWTLFS